jgi:hypothetical protein
MSNDLDQLKKALANVAFIHHKMVTTQFYPEEFNQAKDSLEWIQSFAKELDEKILDLDPELRKKVDEQKKAEAEARKQQEAALIQMTKESQEKAENKEVDNG